MPLHVYSTDNVNSVMRVIRSEKAAKYLNNRKITLETVKHIENYIGKENLIASFLPAYNKFVYRVLVGFLYSNLGNFSFNDRIKHIENVLSMDKKEIFKLIKSNATTKHPTGKLIKIFGIKPAFYVKNVLFKIRRKK